MIPPPEDVSPATIRRNTVLLAASMALGFAGLQHVPSLGSLIATRLTANPGLVSVPMLATVLGLALATYPAGRAMDRVGRRSVLMLGNGLGALGGIALGVGVGLSSFVLVVGAAALVGAGAGIGLMARLAAAEMHPPARRGQAVGAVMIGVTAGAVGGPLLLAGVATWSPALAIDPLMVSWFLAAVLFATAALVVSMVHPDPQQIAAMAAAQVPTIRLPLQSNRLGQHQLLVATSATALVQAAMVTMMSIMPLTIAHAGADLRVSSLMMSLHFVGMYGFSILVGRLADRVGRRPVLGTGGLVTVVGVGLASFTDLVPVMILGLLLVGLGWSCTYVSGTAMVSDAAGPTERGRLLGRYDLLSWLAAAVAILGAGPLLANSGMAAVGTFCAVLALGAIVTSWLLGAGRRVSAAPA